MSRRIQDILSEAEIQKIFEAVSGHITQDILSETTTNKQSYKHKLKKESVKILIQNLTENSKLDIIAFYLGCCSMKSTAIEFTIESRDKYVPHLNVRNILKEYGIERAHPGTSILRQWDNIKIPKNKWERFTVDIHNENLGADFNLKFPGVYVWFVNDKLVYIGKSVNVRNRIKQHFYGGWGEASNMMRNYLKKCSKPVKIIIAVKEESKQFMMLFDEARLIYRLQPELNYYFKNTYKKLI